MSFWKRIFGPKEAPKPLSDVSREWFDSYRKWCDEQVCEGGCGAKGSGRTAEKPWITETLCMECWSKGKRPTEGAGSQWREGPDFLKLTS